MALPHNKGQSKLSDEQAAQICLLYQRGSSTYEIAPQFNISQRYVCRVLKTRGVEMRNHAEATRLKYEQPEYRAKIAACLETIPRPVKRPETLVEIERQNIRRTKRQAMITDMQQMRQAGATLQKIANHYGLSRQAVSLILKGRLDA